MSKGAERQARYAAKQRECGRSQRTFWLTDAEAAAVVALIQRLRSKSERSPAYE